LLKPWKGRQRETRDDSLEFFLERMTCFVLLFYSFALIEQNWTQLPKFNSEIICQNEKLKVNKELIQGLSIAFRNLILSTEEDNFRCHRKHAYDSNEEKSEEE